MTSWLQHIGARIRRFAERALPLNPFARGVTILAGGTALGQGIAILSYPILTRLYSVESFGYLQIYSSALAFPIVIVALRLDFAVLLPADDETAANIVAAAVVCVTVLTGVAAIAAVVLLHSHVSFGRGEALKPYLWLAPVSIFGAGIYQVFSLWSLRQKRFRDVGETRLMQAAAQVGTQLVAGAIRPSLFGLLVGDAFGRSAGALRLARQAWRGNRDVFRRCSIQGMRAAVSRYRNFPLVSSGSALINTAGSSLPTLAIAALYGPRVIGIVALVTRVLDVPSTLIGQAVSQVYSSEAARLAIDSPQSLNALFFATLRRLAALGAVPYLLVMLAAPWGFATIFGAAWREAGVYAAILVPMQFVAFAVWPLIPTLIVLEHQRWQLGWDIGRLALTLSGIWIVHYSGWNARAAVAMYAATMMFGYIAHALLSRMAIHGLMVRAEARVARGDAPPARV